MANRTSNRAARLIFQPAEGDYRWINISNRRCRMYGVRYHELMWELVKPSRQQKRARRKCECTSIDYCDYCMAKMSKRRKAGELAE